MYIHVRKGLVGTECDEEEHNVTFDSLPHYAKSSFFLSFFRRVVYKYKFWIGRFRDDKEICRGEKSVAM
jgi:hypothetical protein